MRTIGLLLLALAACSAGAAPVTVRGTMPCGRWVEQRQPNQVAWGETWLDGALSGYSMALGANLLGGVAREAPYLWMDTYCRNNPLADIDDGVVALVAELRKRKGL